MEIRSRTRSSRQRCSSITCESTRSSEDEIPLDDSQGCKTGRAEGAELLRILAARCKEAPQAAAGVRPRGGTRRDRGYQLRNSSVQAQWASARLVCRLEEPQQPVPDDRFSEARLCGRARRI